MLHSDKNSRNTNTKLRHSIKVIHLIGLQLLSLKPHSVAFTEQQRPLQPHVVNNSVPLTELQHDYSGYYP